MGFKVGKGITKLEFQKAYYGSCVERMDSRETKWMQDPDVDLQQELGVVWRGQSWEIPHVAVGINEKAVARVIPRVLPPKG